jgi:hypothetical protein
VAKKKTPNGETAGGTVIHMHAGGAASGGAPLLTEEDDPELDSLDDNERGVLADALEQVRSVAGSSIDVWRIAPAHRVGYCRAYPSAAFSVDKVAKDYGPGGYRVRAKGPNDRYLKGGSAKFEIAEGLDSGPAAPAAGTGIADLIALMKEDRDRQREEREKGDERWFKWATLLAPVLGPKLLDIFGGGGGKNPTLKDMIEAQVMLKNLSDKPPDMTAQFEQVMRVIEGAKNLVGDDNKAGSTWVDLIRDGLSAAKPVIAKVAAALPMGPLPLTGRSMLPSLPSTPAAGSAPSSATAPPAMPASAPASAAPPAPPSQDGADVGLLEKLNWLRGTLEQLHYQASKNANPRLYAEVTLDNLPPFISVDELAGRLAAPQWWTELNQLDNRIAAQEVWFDEYRAALLRLVDRKKRKEQRAATPPPVAPPDNNEPTYTGDESVE